MRLQSVRLFLFAVVALAIAPGFALAQKARSVKQAFVTARTMCFMTTGPEPMRYRAKLAGLDKLKSGDLRVKVRYTRGKMAMDNLEPGMYSYTVSASHAKKFLGNVRLGDAVAFVEVEGVDPKHPKWTNPTDYLRMIPASEV